MTVPLGRRLVAEAIGTATLVAIGTGTIVLAGRLGGAPLWVIAAAWFLAVLIPIGLWARQSGAHLNPAVTIALVISRRFPRRDALPYIGAQSIGAFAASGIVLGALGDGAHLGSTVPAGGDLVRTFVLELLFTGALVISVVVVTDAGEGRYRWRLLLPPTVVGISTYLIGPWTGSSLNPARTIAPAVWSATYTGLPVYLLASGIAALTLGLAARGRSEGLGEG
ncbi:MAG TPA: MIP/aquaporin family protein [Thermoplasmata archaeon]|nr:MIP/aquaporin family protein [Thermoplasmata archaeon]